MTTMDHPTRQEIEAQRAAILADLGVSAEELAARADAGELVGQEWTAWTEVQELSWLLGE